MENIFKKNYCLILFIIIGLISGLSIQVLGWEDHVINYSVKNSDESPESMENISFSMKDKSDFINIKGISPEDFVSEIETGDEHLFNIFFSIDQYREVSPLGEIDLKLEHDPFQLILPKEDKIIVYDKKAPQIISNKNKSYAVLPGESVRFNVFLEDDWSGVDSESLYIFCNGRTHSPNGYYTKNHSYTDVFAFSFNVPLQEGIYNVYLRGLRDNAGNSTPSTKIGIIKVKQEDDDPEGISTPDESRDVFASSLDIITEVQPRKPR